MQSWSEQECKKMTNETKLSKHNHNNKNCFKKNRQKYTKNYTRQYDTLRRVEITEITPTRNTCNCFLDTMCTLVERRDDCTASRRRRDAHTIVQKQSPAVPKITLNEFLFVDNLLKNSPKTRTFFVCSFPTLDYKT